ncbi:MAG TPA: extracellular solute-binding protein [Acidothermaceae bacterium]
MRYRLERGSQRKWSAVAISAACAVVTVSACSSPSKGKSAAASTPPAAAATAASAPGAASPATSAAGSPAVVPDKPSKPVTLNIIDVAGNLQLTKGMIDDFVKAHPDIVSNVTTTTGTAPSLAGKIQAQQGAGGGGGAIDLVLTGTDGLAAGISQNLWVKLTPDYSAKFPNLTSNYLQGAADMQQLAQGYGIELVYYPSGPLLEYNPKNVPNPPKTPAELLTWAKAHPGKFQYANPANSGPGRTFLMGLPYLLADSDPSNPTTGWAKTWDYLKQLGQYVPYYGSGTTETMKNLANGTVDMIMTTTGWYINPRALGTVPQSDGVSHFDNMTWVSDAQYAVIPKGVSPDVLAADTALIEFMLQPQEQAQAYDTGYFYPGPAVKGVTLSMAPAQSQQVMAQYGNKDFDTWISQFPIKTSLPADAQVTAFDLWTRQIGAGKEH